MKTVTSAESPRVSKAKFIEALTLSGNAHVKSLCLKMPCRGFLFNAQGVISEIEREFLERLLKALQANLSEVKHRLSIGEVFVSHPFKNSIGGLYGVNIDKRQSGLYEAQRTLKRACKGCEWQLSKPNNDGINRTTLDKVVDKIALQLQKNHQKRNCTMNHLSYTTDSKKSWQCPAPEYGGFVLPSFNLCAQNEWVGSQSLGVWVRSNPPDCPRQFRAPPPLTGGIQSKNRGGHHA